MVQVLRRRRQRTLLRSMKNSETRRSFLFPKRHRTGVVSFVLRGQSLENLTHSPLGEWRCWPPRKPSNTGLPAVGVKPKCDSLTGRRAKTRCWNDVQMPVLLAMKLPSWIWRCDSWRHSGTMSSTSSEPSVGRYSTPNPTSLSSVLNCQLENKVQALFRLRI